MRAIACMLAARAITSRHGPRVRPSGVLETKATCQAVSAIHATCQEWPARGKREIRKVGALLVRHVV